MIVVLVSMALVPPADAIQKSVIITANIGITTLSADFTSDITEGIAPLTVHFTDMTPGYPNTWLWDFGDGGTSDLQNPTHVYATSGLYTVTLKVTFPPGVISSKNVTNYIGAFASSHDLRFETPGLTGTTDITFDTAAFTVAGGTWTLVGNNLTLNYPAGSPFKQLVITLDPATITQVNGIITGHVISATLETKDLAGSLIAGVEQHTIIFFLNAIPPPGSVVQTDTIEHADPQNMAAFEALAAQNNLDLLDTCYEMFISTTIPQSTIISMGIKMMVPEGWYDTYSGSTIQIIGVDPGGNAAILSTGGAVPQGNFVIFNAPSFSGYDTFGIAALQGPSPSGDTGVGDDAVPGAVVAEQPVVENIGQPQAAPPQQGLEQLAPAQDGAVASQTADFSLGGDISTGVDGDGRMNLTINRSAIEKSGATIVVENNTVTIDHPFFSIFISCMNVTETQGWIYGEDVLLILPTTKPVEGTISGQSVSAWLDTQLDEIRHGSMITTTLSEPINEEHNKGFENALKNEGLDIQAVDYTMTVTKTNITTTHSSNITMTASPEWVEANGGVDSIYIVRLGDDGKQQVLKTRFIGYDETGNIIFEAESPDGLSVFGLVSAKATEEKVQKAPEATIVPVSKPAMTTNVGMFEWLFATLAENPLLLVIAVGVVAALGYVGWWRRRL